MWWLLLNVVWLVVALGGGYLGYVAGMRREHERWERWYEQEQAIVAADRKKDQEKRAVTLTTVQFRRD